MGDRLLLLLKILCYTTSDKPNKQHKALWINLTITFLLGWFCTGDFDTEATVFHHRLYNTPWNQPSPQCNNYTHGWPHNFKQRHD